MSVRQDGVKVLKNVLPEAQLLENSVAKVLHASKLGSWGENVENLSKFNVRSRSGRRKCVGVLRCAQCLRIWLVETDGFRFLEQYCSPPVTNLQKSESRNFANILDILGHSSESNRWIWLRFVQDGVKILKNVLPEAQLLKNSVAKVMRGLRSDPWGRNFVKFVKIQR